MTDRGKLALLKKREAQLLLYIQAHEEEMEYSSAQDCKTELFIIMNQISNLEEKLAKSQL